MLKGGIRKHEVSNLEGGSLLLSAHVIWKLQKIEMFSGLKGECGVVVVVVVFVLFCFLVHAKCCDS